MESFDAEIDAVLDSLPFSAPCSNLSDSLFLSEEIDTIDEQWWQQLTLPSPKHEGGLEDPEEGAFLADENTGCGAISSSCSSPNVTSTSQPDVAAAPSSSLTKRSADSSPEFEQDDPKRLRRLEKNREAASQSRARKKSYMKDLEVKCRMLEAHVAHLQRVMTMTSMENAALKDELVRVKKPKDSVKTGVAEPAVLESNSLPSEFLRHLSCHYPFPQQVPSPTAGHFQKFLLTLLQLLMLAAVSGLRGPQNSLPQPIREVVSSIPMSMELYRAIEGGILGKTHLRRKKTHLQYDSNFRWRGRSSERRPSRRKCRRVKRLRSSQIL